jgi:hypothetical protein
MPSTHTWSEFHLQGFFIELEVPEAFDASTKMPELLRNWEGIYRAASLPATCAGFF